MYSGVRLPWKQTTQVLTTSCLIIRTGESQAALMATDCGIPASIWEPGCRQVAELWGSNPAQGRKALLETTHLCHCLSSWQKNQTENIYFFFLAGILKSVNLFLWNRSCWGFIFSWLEPENMERAWNLTWPTLEWGGGGVARVYLHSDFAGKKRSGP